VKIGKHTQIQALLALLLVGGAGASGLYAQESEPYSLLFKIRAGLTAGDIQKSHYDNKVMAFAAEVKREMPNIGGALSCEISWEYVPGRHHDVYPWDTNPLYRWGNDRDGNPIVINGLNPRWSFDDRKEYGQGVNLRVAYSAPMPQVFGSWINENIAQKMDWFGGLSIDRHKVRTEVKYNLNFSIDWNVSLTTQDYYPGSLNNPGFGLFDSDSLVNEESKIVPGVFAGVRYSVNRDVGFELSLRNFGMSHFEFTPVSYDVKPQSNFNPKDHEPRTSSGTSRGWALELALTAKF